MSHVCVWTVLVSAIAGGENWRSVATRSPQWEMCVDAVSYLRGGGGGGPIMGTLYREMNSQHHNTHIILCLHKKSKNIYFKYTLSIEISVAETPAILDA